MSGGHERPSGETGMFEWLWEYEDLRDGDEEEKLCQLLPFVADSEPRACKRRLT